MLVRIVEAPSPDEQPYLDRLTKKHGHLYKAARALDVHSELRVLVLTSIATGGEIAVLREHTEELQE